MSGVAVVGLGYVGLPLARAVAATGARVLGLDSSPDVVASLRAGRSHVGDVPDADVAAMLAGGFTPTTDPAGLREADTIVICVPTPLAGDGAPDLGAVCAATETVARHLRAGHTVVLESTTYPGTTREVLLPALERSGLRVGTDVHLGYSPERVDPGNRAHTVTSTPKVVSGVTPACADAVEAFYAGFVDRVVRARGTDEAEMAKLLENTYRHVNIALANEFARVCHELGVDVWDVVDLAATKPFGFQRFDPGPGVGGHCIPIDPGYLNFAVRERLGEPFRFVELAQEINERMPAYVADRAARLLARDGATLAGARVLLVGVTYKAGTADERESPARPLARLLLAAGARVEHHDPHVPAWLDGTHPGTPGAPYDLAIVLVHHPGVDVAAVSAGAARVLDTRGRLDGPRVERL